MVSMHNLVGSLKRLPPTRPLRALSSAVRRALRRLVSRRAPIEVDADPASLDRLLEVVHRVWARNAESAPYLWVLTRPLSRDGEQLYRGAPTPAIIDRFYATGAAEADLIGTMLRRSGADRASFSTILEFGCGAGRVSRWLCQDFDRVIGVDVSERYLAIAARELAAHGAVNFVPLRIATIADLGRLPRYDVLYSRYVLQHNPPPVVKVLLTELLRCLNPGGFAIFQIPTFGATYSYSVARHLATVPEDSIGEMHVFPREAVDAIVRREACEILEARETDDVGEADWKSHTFIVRKTASTP